jgi:DNA repair exonuclease SbcCD ATPase subunit
MSAEIVMPSDGPPMAEPGQKALVMVCGAVLLLVSASAMYFLSQGTSSDAALRSSRAAAVKAGMGWNLWRAAEEDMEEHNRDAARLVKERTEEKARLEKQQADGLARLNSLAAQIKDAHDRAESKRKESMQSAEETERLRKDQIRWLNELGGHAAKLAEAETEKERVAAQGGSVELPDLGALAASWEKDYVVPLEDQSAKAKDLCAALTGHKGHLVTIDEKRAAEADYQKAAEAVTALKDPAQATKKTSLDSEIAKEAQKLKDIQKVLKVPETPTAAP